MPDLMMCRDFCCPRSGQCYRFMAEPNPQGQSWAATFRVDDEDPVCEGFILVRKVQESRP